MAKWRSASPFWLGSAIEGAAGGARCEDDALASPAGVGGDPWSGCPAPAPSDRGESSMMTSRRSRNEPKLWVLPTGTPLSGDRRVSACAAAGPVRGEAAVM